MNNKTQAAKRSDLMQLLILSDAEDLDVLVGYLTDNGKGRISTTFAIKELLVKAREMGRYSQPTLHALVDELCRFGGNSILNFLRGGEGVSYHEVARDVLEHLKGSGEKDEPVESIELKILERMAVDAWKRATPEERATWQSELGLSDVPGPAALAAIQAAIKFGGFASYKVALQVANTMARAILGRGLTLGANAALTRTIAVALGPIGLVVTAIWTAHDLASPAYRVTVPCVVQIAYMRQKLSLNLCGTCASLNPPDAKFCSNCGAPTTKGNQK